MTWNAVLNVSTIKNKTLITPNNVKQTTIWSISV